MANPILPKDEADTLVSILKIVNEPTIWKQKPSGWRLKVKAMSPNEKEPMFLVGFVGKTNYSFALLYKTIPLRRFTKHGPHKVGGVLFTEPHKHVWGGDNSADSAYIPEDINPNDDINAQFLSFCTECNISLKGQYQSCMGI